MNQTPASRRDVGAPARLEPVRALFLVGFMGAGKTSVGRALSRRLGWRFEDLDLLIETRQQRTIAQIFGESGEARFRKAEHEALRALVTQFDPQHPIVVALGGGAFVQAENASLLAGQHMASVFLDTPVEELWQRCSNPGEAERPLRVDETQFRALYESRRPSYLAATLRLETSGKTVDQIAQEVMDGLELEPKVSSKEK